LQPSDDAIRLNKPTLRQSLAQGLASTLARRPAILIAAFAAIGIMFSLAVLDRIFPL
jgi:hypothetical protein